jgi:hypothetical protein
MSNLKVFRWTLLLLLLPAVNVLVAQGQEINFCAFRLSPGVMQANASFNAIYDFNVNKDGVPINIKAIARQFTDPIAVQTCIGEWRLPESALKHLVAVFQWDHGTGWTRLAISGPGIKLTIHLSGQGCPYCENAQKPAKPTETLPK